MINSHECPHPSVIPGVGHRGVRPPQAIGRLGDDRPIVREGFPPAPRMRRKTRLRPTPTSRSRLRRAVTLRCPSPATLPGERRLRNHVPDHRHQRLIADEGPGCGPQHAASPRRLGRLRARQGVYGNVFQIRVTGARGQSVEGFRTFPLNNNWLQHRKKTSVILLEIDVSSRESPGIFSDRAY